MSDSVSDLLSDLMGRLSKVREEYAQLFAEDAPQIPIPFFGALETAKVVTIGLNPSDTEFHNDRWAGVADLSAIEDRLRAYFSQAQVPSHRWFETWSQALSHIGVSYADGSAAHIDICPWATRPMSSFQDHDEFTELVEASADGFERSLKLARGLRLVLIAGTVNKGTYLNEYLQRVRLGDVHLTGPCHRPKGSRGFVIHHVLQVSSRQVPVFFCSVSPSSWTKRLLPERVLEFSEGLRASISGGAVQRIPADWQKAPAAEPEFVPADRLRRPLKSNVRLRTPRRQMPAQISQRDMMRQLYRDSKGDERRTIAAYVRAERDREVQRRSNNSQLSAEQYAQALLRDGKRKGWL